MKWLVALGILTLIACAALSANANKPFEPRIDHLAIPAASGWIDAHQIPLPPLADQIDTTAGPVLFVGQDGIDHFCGGRNLYVACAIIGGSWMVLPNPCQPRFRGQSYAAIACHEIGHNRGWTH